MDPICEEKINFLQKYVPFLANLIELLANDSGKEGKLAQMQLLYNLLNKPDNSVKIETLEKCEEVLSRVFGNADEKCNEPEIPEATVQYTSSDHNKTEMETIVKINQLETADKGDASEQTNGYTNVEDTLKPLKSKNTNNDVSKCLPDESTIDIDAEDLQIPDCSGEKDKSADEVQTCTEDAQNEPKQDFNLASNKIEMIDNNTEENNISTLNSTNKDLNSFKEIQSDTATTEQISSSNEKMNANESMELTLSDDGEMRMDGEEESLLVELPDVGEESLLVEATNGAEESLLVEAESCSSPCETDTIEAAEQTDVFIQNPTEILPFKIISAESLATSSDRELLEQISLEKNPEELTETAKDERKTYDPLDPLNPTINLMETPMESSLIGKIEAVALDQQDNRKYDYDDDEDDDVLLIETRSSPICIDSDPEDEESVKPRCPMPPIHTKISTETTKPPQKSKTSARKSTSIVNNSVRYASNNPTSSSKKTASHRKTKELIGTGYIVKKDPKLLMETINLIDSDSDEDGQKTKNVREKNDDDVIIVGASSEKSKLTQTKKTTLVLSNKRLTPKLHLKHSPKPPTAQSNFLNAVNLQPTPESSPNQASHSSHASNKRATIPNAIHTNTPNKRKPISSPTAQPGCKIETASSDAKSSSVSVPQVHDKMLKEWLECFLKNFASPLQVASHACFVLLQRVLKYRFFQRLKVTRLVLNMRAKNCEPGKIDVQILLDLRNIFIQNDVLTEAGRRFCRFATNDAFGKPVALTTDARSGKITCRTRIVSSVATPCEKLKTPERTTSSTQTQVASTQKLSSSTTTSSTSPPAPSCSTPLGSNTNSCKRMKKVGKLSDGGDAEGNNDNDYTPYMGELVLEDDVVSERKKSLRTNRTKRKEAGFTYSEDHDDEEFEALAKKIEDKKREELRLAEERELEKERDKERKIKKTVAKKTTSKRQSSVAPVDTGLPKEPVRKKLRLADAEMLGTADDDLLTPTWVEAEGDDDDGEVDSLLDFAEEPQTPENHTLETDSRLAEDDKDASQETEYFEKYPPWLDVDTNKLLKNTSRAHHTQCKKFDLCVHCVKRVPRIVHHYVNDHRSAEVFTSRLRTRDIRRLLTTSNVGFVHLYKGNQQQYAAHCIFCDKEVKFLLPYWFEHFTMHTGEYSFKCSGCDIRKPTRSLLANHLQSGTGCPRKGTAVRLHTFDTKSNQIEAHICTICNYVQLHRKNVLRHLLTQHEIETVSPNHIIKVVLLQVSGPYRDEDTIKNDESQLSLLQSSDDEESGINGAPMSSMDGSSIQMQNDFTDNDDLSFLICGMLDVQTNLSASGNTLGNEDETNSVDNK